MLVHGTLLDGSLLRVGNLKEVGNPLRTGVIGAQELLFDFAKAFADEAVSNVRAKCLRELGNAARISADAIIDVVCVLFLESVREGHTFHYEERNDGGHAALDREMSAARKLSLNRNEFVVFEDQIASSGLSGASILNNLGPVRAACASILSGQQIDFDGNRGAV